VVTLEVGKLGNVVLLTGDPLSVTSWVERVVIEGREVYDRRTDIRNKHLIEGIQPLGTTPAAVESGGDDRNADEEEDDE
jgi:hypothetical protein